MGPMNPESGRNTGRRLSLDAWAVIVALAAVVLIRTGVVRHIPW
jgi:hypothetical protein